jgi:MOSC domain-containing protein YiiM
MNQKRGQVIELFISHKGESKRISQNMLEVDSYGIVDDKFYAKDIARSILLTSLDSYSLALKHGIEMPYGALGENILIDYNPYELPIGTQLTIGEVLLEVTQNCTLCSHLSLIDKRLPRLLKEDRGIFVKVVEGGFIKQEDEVYLKKYSTMKEV